ncbi:putative ADP-ribosylation factor GTPase-activating protein AGD5 [Senna tora]|uniref:Putative ADP-ribosylation factor GTPase-activating protein AGD5 n=1 Tax=Senna tora TaxID=362788 RepID=A0A835CAZ1_9FABA|nr:putative ADP-ribosylation factor GTPase-activating protein AGD5 [Senna tora]
MQCSGIHRSLGVHISKVRSATLDTWLPEQVAFIQSMGNEKANSYWEAELPPNYDRVGIENFIRAKYEEKRWLPRDGKPKSPSRQQEERTPYWQRHTERTGHGYAPTSENTSHERKRNQPSNAIPATRISAPAPPKVPEQVTPLTKPQHVEKAEPAAPEPQVETTKQATVMDQNTPPKVDYATDLFNMLSMDGPSENNSEEAGSGASDNNNWAGFQSAAEVSTAEKSGSTKAVESTPQSNSGIEDLFKDSPSLIPVAPDKPQKDLKGDIMSLFEKSNMVSPFSMHQQQLAMLAQQQSLLMAAAANSTGGNPRFPGSVPQPGLNGSNIPVPSWPAAGYSVPGVLPMGGPGELQKLMQIRNDQLFVCGFSLYTLGQVNPINGMTTTTGVSKPQSAATTVSSSTSTQATKDDFSSLIQGMFAKH